MSFRYVTETGN